MTRLALLSVVSFVALGSACSGPPSDERYLFTGPPRASFPPAADALAARCGSVDCHGVAPRNLRIYSVNGLRINAITGQGATTQEEYDATYTSVVSIDPEVLALVLQEGGFAAERWIVISKGQGYEAHKGGTAMPLGSAADRCLKSWLRGAVDPAACLEASEFLAPEAP
jgi:hypothetical protein